jgi:MerR family mercuric resistance operon transcriptional regulator
MAPHFTIGELARRAHVPVSTIRYYERAGLLPPSARSGSNYRLYGNVALNRLVFIRAAQISGFRLEDIQVILSIPIGEQGSCDKVQHLIEGRLNELEQRLKDLQHVRSVLRTSLHQCLLAQDRSHCTVLDRIQGKALSSLSGAAQTARRRHS